MPSSLWPDSATRKMYGQAGLKQEIRNQKQTFTAKLYGQEKAAKMVIETLQNKIKAYESLKWYKKLWLAIKELFGHRNEILQG